MNYISMNCVFPTVNEADAAEFGCGEASTTPNIPVFQMTMPRSNRSVHIEYTVATLDLMLGIIGGFASLIWSVMSLCLGGYEEFWMQTSLLENFYTAQKAVT